MPASPERLSDSCVMTVVVRAVTARIANIGNAFLIRRRFCAQVSPGRANVGVCVMLVIITASVLLVPGRVSLLPRPR